jgi:hypothetical protein
VNPQKKIKIAFDLVCSDYKEMFKTHYPKASGGGINEATQTYYFCKNLSQTINHKLSENEVKASLSLEMPYGKNKRMDGVIVSPSTKEIFLIQAKRLKNSQTESIVDDVNKVFYEKKDVLNKIELSDDSIDYSIYLVILADMWLHNSTPRKTKNRLSIPNWWAGESYTDDAFELLQPSEDTFIQQVPFELNWKNENQLIYRFHDFTDYLDSKSVLNEYCLFCGFSKI